jgi:hypothetical protein
VSTAEAGAEAGCLGVKQLRNVVVPRTTFSGRRRVDVIARERAADWRVAQLGQRGWWIQRGLQVCAQPR